ncbi:hypothetical protein [Streptomyces asiaticus]|uniref:hypothetical protein n=1 Tax=Streptomyces asiaticus TaxID=114695 RepID=UPI003F6653D3
MDEMFVCFGAHQSHQLAHVSADGIRPDSAVRGNPLQILTTRQAAQNFVLPAAERNALIVD